MTIEVDQSNKVERTNRDTVLASSSDCRRAIVLPSRVKQQLISQAKAQRGSNKTAYLKVFAICVFILLEPCLSELAKKGTQIVIDTEYPGHEATIKGVLLRCIRKAGYDFRSEQIYFEAVGKGSGAHHLALQVSRGQVAPDYRVSYEEIVRLL